MIFKKTLFKKSFLALIALLITFTAYSQLTASSSVSPTQLVQTVLLGSGVTASNITYNGAPLTIGSFNGFVSNIGLPAGVIMSSGDIANADGTSKIVRLK